MKTSADLLQALLDRQRAEKAAAASATPAATSPAPSPAKPTEAKVDRDPATLPVVELKPARTQTPRPISGGTPTRGITLTFPMFVTAIVFIGGAIVAAFLLGRWTIAPESTTPSTSATPASSRPNIPTAPSVPPFEWAKKFTVEAASSGASEIELNRLVELSKYLGKQGVAASPFKVVEGGKSVGAIFLGGADSGNDKSLVKLRDWLREIPGPDGTGRPFQSARIRETPRPEKK